MLEMRECFEFCRDKDYFGLHGKVFLKWLWNDIKKLDSCSPHLSLLCRLHELFLWKFKGLVLHWIQCQYHTISTLTLNTNNFYLNGYVFETHTLYDDWMVNTVWMVKVMKCTCIRVWSMTIMFFLRMVQKDLQRHEYCVRVVSAPGK
jgi:hypothetical protein